MLLWKIFYGDGSTYSNLDGDPFDAPSLNVQIIVHTDKEHGRVLRGKCDFYWLVDGGWHGGDHFGLWDYLHRPGPKKVIFGRSLSWEEYQTVVKAALDDADFPTKSAIALGEEF